MKKLIISIVAIALLLGALTACQVTNNDPHTDEPQGEDATKSPAQDQPSSQEPETPPAPGPSQDQVPDKDPEPEPEPEPELEPEPLDDRGISGLKGTTLVMLLSGSYDIPSVMLDSDKPEEYAYQCVSSADQNGVKLAYQIKLDEDKEVIKGSFSATSTTKDVAIVQNAADLYFYAIAIQEYDTSDKDTLVAWMEDTVATVDATGASITIGDAKYFMYSMGRSFYLDVTKVS